MKEKELENLLYQRSKLCTLDIEEYKELTSKIIDLQIELEVF